MTDDRREKIESSQNDRREFMTTAGKLAAVLGVLGISGEAWAASKGGKDSPNSAKSVLEQAIKTGDMNETLQTHGSKLDKRQVQVLKSLTKSDLQQLQGLQRKLSPLGGGELAHGYGVF